MAESEPSVEPNATIRNPPSFRHRASVRFLAAFFVLWLVFGWVALQLPALPDTDSYFHLAVARLYAEEGWVDQLPWLRFSLLRGIEGVGFGDKELLFHGLLAPFAAFGDGTDGGRLALAFWNALAFTTLAAVGRRAAGNWGILVPVLLWLGSMDFLGRLIRLRPETPAMILFVLAALCVGSRKYRWLGVVALVFTLTYTAFHALLGLCLIWFLWQAWQDRRTGGTVPWPGLIYPMTGFGAGFLLHPHFPQNLVLWKVQSIDFFRWKDQLDVGTEIGAQATDKLLLANLPWFAGCAILLLAALTNREGDVARDLPSARDPHLRGISDAMTLAAACFGLLYLLMMRFSTHALPILTLALLFRLAAAGHRPGRSMRLPGGLRLPTALALTLVLAVGAWRSTSFLYGVTAAPDRETEWKALGQAIPEGARVAAPWGQTPQYHFWAPTASFLNDLDPVFMAVPYPEAYWLQRSVFDGSEPDVPMAVAAGLDSDYLAMSRFLMPPRLAARLTADPRAQLVYEGWNLLYRMTPPTAAGSGTFLVDWNLVPQGGELPVPPTTDITRWLPYPRLDEPRLRSLEAFVDGRRIDRPGRCFAVSHDLAPGTHHFELAPVGPTTLWYQPAGQPAESIQILDSPGAVLGRGVVFAVPGDPDRGTRLSVVSCLARTEEPKSRRQIGFYLRRLH
ncbi:MAG: hypothetical protein MPN21_02055 [Thermoanaerobaculia bacterium]|nr:hypothetical protein [Thermoanaerobaculia bacterium]